MSQRTTTPPVAIGAVALAAIGLGVAGWWAMAPAEVLPDAERTHDRSPQEAAGRHDAAPTPSADGSAVRPVVDADEAPAPRRPPQALLDALDLPPDPPDDRPPPTAEAQAWQARLKEPDAVWYGNTGAGWRAIQRALVRGDAPPALTEDVAALVQQLRGARRAPDHADLTALRALHGATIRRLEGLDGLGLQPYLDALSEHDAALEHGTALP